MDARVLAGFGMVAAACRPDYVHVVVETADIELVGTPWTVSVRAFGDGHIASKNYRGFFRGPPPLYHTDFVLVLDDAPDEVDLRVGVWDAPSRWAGDRVVVPPGDGRQLHILLYAGEEVLASSRPVDGDLKNLTRFSTGLAVTWLGLDGVALSIERVPDSPVRRAVVIDPDTSARKLRIASQPTTNVFGPNLAVVSWIGGDGAARLFLQYREQETGARDVIKLRNGTDAWAAVAPSGGTFTAATAVAAGSELWLAWYDGEGSRLGEMTLPIAGNLRSIRGFLVGPGDAMLIAVENMRGEVSLLRRSPGATEGLSIAIAELNAMSLNIDQSRLFTVQRDRDLFVRAYDAATLAPIGDESYPIVEASRVPAGAFGGVSIDSCAVVWPEERDDGADSPNIDLRVQDLDGDGRPQRASRLANGEIHNYHFAPTLACMSPSLAYVTFLVSDANQQTSELKLRKVPPAPIE